MHSTLTHPFAHRSTLLGLAFVALLAGGTVLPAAEPGERAKVIPPVPLKRVAPVHPPQLLKSGNLKNGQAVLECVVIENGTVRDIKVVSATLPEFGQAAADALQQWEFKPGELAGQPTIVRLQVPFDFVLTPEMIIEAAVERPVFEDIKDLIISARELPSWPRPIQFLLPRYPESLKGSGKYGKAVVSVVINKEGKVMNPTLVKATYPEFILPSLVTAARLVFPPQIMANNERICVSMDIQFDFKPDTNKPKPKEPPTKKEAPAKK